MINWEVKKHSMLQHTIQQRGEGISWPHDKRRAMLNTHFVRFSGSFSAGVIVNGRVLCVPKKA
jgi:hypothetical protein